MDPKGIKKIIQVLVSLYSRNPDVTCSVCVCKGVLMQQET